MSTYLKHISLLIKRLAIVFLFFTSCRLLFLIFNYSYFKSISGTDIFDVFFYGLRFDALSIFGLNSLFILLSVLPFPFITHRPYQKLLKVIFLVINSISIALNFMDFAYFPYTQKRTTYDVVNLIFGGQSDFLTLLPEFIKTFWYVFIIYAVFIWVLNKLYNYTKKYTPESAFVYTFRNTLSYIITFLLIVGISTLAIRGGTQRVPLSIVDAGNFTKPTYIPILLNTPFSIIKSIELKHLEEVSFYSEQELHTFINPIKPKDTSGFKPFNVCVLILESFSKEYTSLSHRKSYTPFLDSLMNQSLVCTNAWSNGKKSIEGIPAILAGIPSIMEDPYLNSVYSSNNINGIASLLKTKGYTSGFFHGGTNGTMNFDAFSKLAGFDNYYGRSEYNNEADYDGHWGIWDEPFLQYVVKQTSTFKEPFLTSVFTLSSHHPYTVPNKYNNKFPKGPLEIHEVVGYTDYALRCFFETAKTQSWFKNTLFVITADHTGISDDAFYANNVGQYTIPIIYYLPDNSMKGTHQSVTQQIDILPSVLDVLNYDIPMYALGTSVFQPSKKSYGIYYNNSNCYVVNDSIVGIINNYNLKEVYNYKNDSSLHTNLINTYNYSPLLNYGKAVLQTYNHDLTHNCTTIK